MIVSSLLVLTSVTGEVAFAIRNIHQLPIALNALGPVASKLSVFLKVLLLFYHRKEVLGCLTIFRDRMDEGEKSFLVAMFFLIVSLLPLSYQNLMGVIGKPSSGMLKLQISPANS